MTSNYLPGAQALEYWQGRECKRVEKMIVEGNGPSLKPALTAVAAKIMFDAACNLIHVARETRNIELSKKWFGEKSSFPQYDIDKLYMALTHESLKLRFATNKKTSLGAYDPSFSVPNVAQLGLPILYTRYSWGEKVMTLLHEMSHSILGTLDYGAGKPGFDKLGACYGPMALKLAKNSLADSPWRLGWDKAIKNAENWGYFLVSHYVQIQDDDHLGYADEFDRLDDKTLKDYDSYLAGRAAAGQIDIRITDQ